MPQSKTSVPVSKKSSPLPIIFLILTIGILGAGGYVVYQTLSGKGMTSLPGVAMIPGSNGSILKVNEDDFSNISDPLIRKHFVKQYSTSKFKITSTSDGLGKNNSSVVTVDYRSGTDSRTQMVQTVDGKESQNLIIIGETTYLKDPKDGKWWMQKKVEVKETQSAPEPTMKEYSPEAMKKEVEEMKATYKKLGEEPCGTLTCYKYEEDFGDKDSGKRTFWFDTKELLLRKEQSGYGEFTSESTYSYDNINVSAPSPTKEVPAGKTVYDMMVADMMGGELPKGEGMPSQEEINTMMKQLKTNQPDQGGADYSPSQDAPADDSGN